MSDKLACFKAYDVRGKVPSELDADLAYRIGRAVADETGCSTCAVGFDARLSSPEIASAACHGLRDAGVEVMDIGLCGTEMVYFATAHYGLGAGIMVTASHNPPEYNGMKIVREESRPISGDSGLDAIERRTRLEEFSRQAQGSIVHRDVYDDFIEHLRRVVKPEDVGSLRVLASAGNGCAGIAMRKLTPHYAMNIEEMDFEPDGTFPHGVPNPILEESRARVVDKMKSGDYDFGVAWDGDYDRCFFFDERGRFIEGYYIVGLLAQDTLMNEPGATIIHDPRLTWNTLEICNKLGGRAVQCKTGHAFIKERMRAEDATYGGEMSAHHYFKAHWYCDSGMIPFLMVARLLTKTRMPLSALVDEMMSKYPCSGEINSTVEDPKSALARIEQKYADGVIDRTDGLSIEFPHWRFNVRASNTEPVVRLNVESRGDKQLVEEKSAEILALLRA